jgi:hypothetical protein
VVVVGVVDVVVVVVVDVEVVACVLKKIDNIFGGKWSNRQK